jgi:elongation factor Ts
MATITAEQVRELREQTGAGMMECKRALVESNGSIELAIAAMRKAGMAKAAKRADRTAAEGVIALQVSADHKMGILIEVNCETDFVARDQNLTNFAQHIAARALAEKISSLENLMVLPYDKSGEKNSANTIEQTRQELITKLGENIQVRRLTLLKTDGMIGAYKHGERIGVLVQLNVVNPELGKDIAMHIAANNPQAVAPENVPAELIAKEKEIFSAQAASSGKPAEIIEKMIQGRINKYLQEISLVSQPFVKNPDQTVADLLKAANAKVQGFARFQVGEGIEKRTSNFAEEVAAQVKSSS